MTASHGAYGNADATTAATSNAASSNGAASTDESLNARVRTSKSPRPNKWGIIIAAVVAIDIIVGAVAIFNGRNAQQSANKADTVTIGLKLAPPSLDIRRQSGSAIEQVLIGNVYEGLVSRDSDNAVQPGLAKSWDISTDGTTYTFHLNRNMTFSNGDVLDADDVAWSINQLKEKQYYNANQVESLSKAEALDANTVRITLSSPDSNLLWYLTGRPGLVFDKDATYNAKTQAVGSGPYTVESFDSASKMVLKANPKYWGTAHKPATQHVVIDFITDDNAAVNALKSGDVDVLSPVNATLAKSLDTHTYHVSASDGSDKFVLAFNCANKKLADKRVRQAIRYGINHKEIIASRGGVDTALGGPIPSVDPGYEDLTGLYPYDVAKAKNLMTQAGYSTDHPLELTLTYANTYGTELGDQLKSQLAAIGIDLNINYVEFSTWLQDVHANGDYELSLVDHAESHDFYKWTTPEYYYHYDNKDVQALYAKALAATDEKESDEYLKQAAKTVSEDAPADWLFGYRVTVAYNKGVKGFPDKLSQTVLPLWQISKAE
ncbi:ABC transporter substrate-binding protein [Bifidobacterium angulatum]|uniref:ABC transporter, substrate-binding protein, family 5 n=1 Tax=Bifidobacterium angulatum DSM 20098 = JCM 7096 TaxID=518635 RepID=C4FDV3_9BIFI|nr:ABC transporter substrate-binding protein [Bifidobacterium angulatum]EEP21134.1 ABC transporter, substrate-binding protein, family 5 [Bifidobacterium angulatum DSM 20098 = JCM 7096]KFI38709.1 oligopeptide ABC transporter, substrate-binding protein [Bifidobacterium angulatum]BAQ96049.1 peptides ABC transporter substrate binding component [Bifidobacterium angulatum DSM 20098 = JCM 7096]